MLIKSSCKILLNIGKLSLFVISRGRELQNLVVRYKKVRCPEADLYSGNYINNHKGHKCDLTKFSKSKMKKVTETTLESKGAVLWESAIQIKCYTLNS